MSAVVGGPAVPVWLQPLASALPGVRSADLDWREDRLGPQVAARPAAVLVLLADGPTGPEVLLTERAGTLRQHSGQVAFPGGRADPGDASPSATALREAGEEVGLAADGVDVLGQLPSLQLRHSRHEVTAVVGYWRAPGPVRVVDRAEVARVESVPLAELYATGNRCRVRAPGGYEGPAFATRGLLVWGFTAEVLVRVLRLGGLEPAPVAAAEPPRVLGIEDALGWARS